MSGLSTTQLVDLRKTVPIIMEKFVFDHSLIGGATLEAHYTVKHTTFPIITRLLLRHLILSRVDIRRICYPRLEIESVGGLDELKDFGAPDARDHTLEVIVPAIIPRSRCSKLPGKPLGISTGSLESWHSNVNCSDGRCSMGFKPAVNLFPEEPFAIFETNACRSRE